MLTFVLLITIAVCVFVLYYSLETAKAYKKQIEQPKPPVEIVSLKDDRLYFGIDFSVSAYDYTIVCGIDSDSNIVFHKSLKGDNAIEIIKQIKGMVGDSICFIDAPPYIKQIFSDFRFNVLNVDIRQRGSMRQFLDFHKRGDTDDAVTLSKYCKSMVKVEQECSITINPKSSW